MRQAGVQQVGALVNRQAETVDGICRVAHDDRVRYGSRRSVRGQRPVCELRHGVFNIGNEGFQRVNRECRLFTPCEQPFALPRREQQRHVGELVQVRFHRIDALFYGQPSRGLPAGVCAARYQPLRFIGAVAPICSQFRAVEPLAIAVEVIHSLIQWHAVAVGEIARRFAREYRARNILAALPVDGQNERDVEVEAGFQHFDALFEQFQRVSDDRGRERLRDANEVIEELLDFGLQKWHLGLIKIDHEPSAAQPAIVEWVVLAFRIDEHQLATDSEIVTAQDGGAIQAWHETHDVVLGDLHVRENLAVLLVDGDFEILVIQPDF